MKIVFAGNKTENERDEREEKQKGNNKLTIAGAQQKPTREKDLEGEDAFLCLRTCQQGEEENYNKSCSCQEDETNRARLTGRGRRDSCD